MYLPHKFFSIKVLVTVCRANMTAKVRQLLIRYLGFLMGSQFGKGWEEKLSVRNLYRQYNTAARQQDCCARH